MAILALLTLFAYSDLRYLEKRINSGVVIYEYLDTLLESRLQERNYSVSGDNAYLIQAVEFASQAMTILLSNRAAFIELQPVQEIETLQSLLAAYLDSVSRYRDLVMTGIKPTASLASDIQKYGFELNALGQVLSKAERTRLGISIRQSQAALLVTVLFIALLGLFAGYRLSRVSLRPLDWLEKELAAIGDGRYNQVHPLSDDQEILSMSRAVNRMLQDIEARNRHLMQSEKLVSLGTLASGIAHELNNPLANVSASCQILIEEMQQNSLNNAMEWLEQIDREVERAKRIVRSILEFSRESRVHKTLILLNELVDNSLLLMGRRYQVRVNRDDVPDNLFICVDIQMLQQVFINLFQNAIDAGGPEVEIRIRAGVVPAGAIHLPSGMVSNRSPYPASPETDQVWIELEDDGPGIPPEVMPRVFDPFFTTKAVGHGEGLGLYITHEIIDLHEGYIGVESNLGVGTKFLIYLPVVRGERH